MTDTLERILHVLDSMRGHPMYDYALRAVRKEWADEGSVAARMKAEEIIERYQEWAAS